MSTESLAERLAKADAALRAGDPQTAFGSLRPALEYPTAVVDDEGDFVAGFGMLARIAHAIAGPEFGAILDRVAAQPNDIAALYDAGYAAYEQSLHRIAATVLLRADELAPGHPKIVAELSSALEALLAYGHAAIMLDRSGLPDRDPLHAYLSGFNHMMSGGIDRAAMRVLQLEPEREPTLVHMRESLRGMLLRAEAVRGAGIDVGEHALTAWHAIINGSLLLHESRFGYDEPMRGRYAYLSDSTSLMRAGIDGLVATLAAGGPRPTEVIAAPDRASRILALAVSRALSLPMQPWAAGAPPGLVVVWNLDAVGDAAFLEAYQDHREGDVLFVHASSWVDPFPYAPDITTLLAQTVTNPHTGGGLRVDPDTQQVVPAEADERDESVLADELLAAEPEASQTSPTLVLELRRALEGVPEPHGLGLLASTGRRLRQRAGSPVQSARFT